MPGNGVTKLMRIFIENPAFWMKEKEKFINLLCICTRNKQNMKRRFIASSAGDRKIFFPTTNTEPLVSMMYLDFISSPEVIEYLQIGEEGVTHNKLEDGAVEIIAATKSATLIQGR